MKQQVVSITPYLKKIRRELESKLLKERIRSSVLRSSDLRKIINYS